MCDVENPLYGPNGAACVFGTQKGADIELVKKIDAGLENIFNVILNDLGFDVSHLSGGGASGGIGAGLHAFLSAELQPDIDTILKILKVEDELFDTDLIITGEGKIDSQSIEGNAISGIVKMATKKHIPVIAVVGDIGEHMEALYTLGLSGIFSINRVAKDFQYAKMNSKANPEFAMYNLF